MPTKLPPTAACVLLLAAACASDVQPQRSALAVQPPSGDTVAILPDTQFYACAYPDIFERQAQWLAEHGPERGIALVLHTGDIVDSDLDAQWQVAGDSMARLRGAVPYLVTSGNHDLMPDRGSHLGDYFDASELTRYTWEAGTFDPWRPDSSYAVVVLAGRPWLFMGLEFAPRDAVVQWASEVLAAHADMPAVLFTHAYLYADGQRYDRTVQPMQPYHPDLFAMTPEQGHHDGEDLWRELIEPHENVRLVVSGHVIPDGVARSISLRASGSVVHELLANYQTCDLCPCSEAEGGGGYLRLLRFGADGRSIAVETYSPYFDVRLTDTENQFELRY